MILSSCPLRISLVGGSTDHPKFIEKYGNGSVISFASNLRTYVTIHRDLFGSNSVSGKYSISYSKKECVEKIDDIENELVRNCFSHLNVEKINCSLVSDIYSSGSGLASSSAYLLSMVKAIYAMRNEFISEFEVCKISEEIEKKFNPLVGQQDFYGSIGGLKRINFFRDQDPEIKFMGTSIFNEMDMHLLYTGVIRNSTKVLETIDIDKSLTLLDDVRDLENSISSNDKILFNNVIRRSWENKKNTSRSICSNDVILEIDDLLGKNPKVLSHKLCGAGNGGYFLIFTERGNKIDLPGYKIEKIFISENGIKVIDFKDGITRI